MVLLIKTSAKKSQLIMLYDLTTLVDLVLTIDCIACVVIFGQEVMLSEVTMIYCYGIHLS